jgi:hypothetical protein
MTAHTRAAQDRELRLWEPDEVPGNAAAEQAEHLHGVFGRTM